MVTHTRLDCAVASAGLMRLAAATALHHCRHRSAFGRPLAEQPLMAQVLADLALEVEAATALAFRLARSFDGGGDPRELAWRRLMTPVSKYWVCKTAQAVIGESMECLGGNGYVEESLLPRLYREAPVNSIWEGSGNVMALDVLRVLQREADAARVVLEELEQMIGDDAQLKAALERIRGLLYEPRLLDQRGRVLIEALALTAAGAMLRAHSPRATADAFIGTRLAGPPHQTYGQGLERADLKAILARALPE
jgi:putative acyl-CoA dehydrogenase